jgi:hypothetical protein
LNRSEELAVVAFLKTLSDGFDPRDQVHSADTSTDEVAPAQQIFLPIISSAR